VCAHLGLQPQFVHKMGAFKVQGRDDAAAEAMLHDILHVSPMVTIGHTPRFVKNYMAGSPDIESAVRMYVGEGKSGAYPAPEHCFGS